MDNLVNNYYFLKQLASSFKQQLVGRHVREVYAQNKNEFVFSVSKDGDNWALVFYYGHQLSFAFLDKKAKPCSGAYLLFTDVNELPITNVQVMPNDRSLLVTLDDQYQLLFKLYGAHGNVILFRNGYPVDTIRKRIQKDQTAPIDNYKQTIDQSLTAYENLLNAGFDQWEAIKKLFPTFTGDFNKALVRYGFEDK
jgi:predicted ribosome quality control (RQC) complex YloA/Tae2 family protein